MCARCMLIWEIEELREKLEEMGSKLGCWFYVDVTEDLMVLWRAYKDKADGDSVELLSNGDIGCSVADFEADVEKMPHMVLQAIRQKF